MYNDPLSSSNYLRVTAKDEAIDGQGIHYRIERKHELEIHPLFVVFSFVCLIILLAGCGGDLQPQLVNAAPQAATESVEQSCFSLEDGHNHV